MHFSLRVVSVSVRSYQAGKSSARRCYSSSGVRRSFLAFAERQEREQPWSADQAGSKYAVTPYVVDSCCATEISMQLLSYCDKFVSCCAGKLIIAKTSIWFW